jgi:hypothetical protein
VKTIFNIYRGILRGDFQTFLSRWPNVFGTLIEIRILTTSTNSSVNTNISLSEGKGKAIPLQALTGPEGSRRLRLPDFMTMGT